MNNEKILTALSASSISGTSVLNPSMETIGSIEDLMIDLNTGEVIYAVLSVDTGFLNMGSKHFAIPLEEFDFKPESKEAMLRVDKEKLENSPGFDKDNWPKGPQHNFVEEVFTYYGRKYPRQAVSQPSTHAPESKQAAGADKDFVERGGYIDKTSVSKKPSHASTNPNFSIH
jgi:sporulation protein YlmC with PRC-barrel domain